MGFFSDLGKGPLSFFETGKDIIEGFSGEKAAEAQKQAAQAQKEGQLEALDFLGQQESQRLEHLRPFIDLGTQAQQQLAGFAGLQGPQVQQGLFAGLRASPGQQFLQQQQEKALVRQASRIGGLGGGRVRAALGELGAQQGQALLNQRLNTLTGLGSAGLQAIGGTSQFAPQQAGLISGAGQTEAGGILGAQQAITDAHAALLETATAIGSMFAGGGAKPPIPGAV